MSFLYLCLTSTKMTENRSSHPELLCKIVFRNFAKLTGQLVCQSLFFNKVAGLRPKTLLKKRLWHGFFPVNFKNKNSYKTPAVAASPRSDYETTLSENKSRENFEILFNFFPILS